MYKKLTGFVLIFTFFICYQSTAQLNLATVDQRTYQLWQEKDWKQLIKEGRQALHKGIDFYYLRVRMGIACYEKKNYQQAILHFEKARAFNDQEEYVTEYLYYAYLYSGRTEEARNLSGKMSDALKAQTGTTGNPFIRKLLLFYNTDFKSEKTTSSNFSTANIDTLLKGDQYIANQNKYFHLALQHDIGRKFTLNHGYSYIHQDYFLYNRNDVKTNINQDYVNNVHQYYLSGQVRLARNWRAGLGFHYVGVRYPVLNRTPGMGPGRFQKSVVTDHQVVLFFHLKKDFPYFSTQASLYYSNLNDATQLQTDLKLSVYPLGNLNLYTLTTVSYQIENSGRDRQSIVLTQEIGGKIFRYLWIEGFFTLGEMQNYTGGDGTLVFNSANIIKSRIGGRLIFPVHQAVSLQAGYTYAVRESSFIPADSGIPPFNTIQYHDHSITGGLIWKFSKQAGF